MPGRVLIARKASNETEQRIALDDARLVRECLRGADWAWPAFVEKYKKLIFSIPLKYGLSVDDAADIFQAVCLEILSELPKLRRPKALPKWIMQITAHKCFRHKRQSQRTQNTEPEGENGAAGAEPSVPARADEVLHQAEEEQVLREAIGGLPERCQRLIHMLFFEDPPRPYHELAEELGLSRGSVGFIRQRCLERLKKRLGEAGFS